jgi:hypothetical protein
MSFGWRRAVLSILGTAVLYLSGAPPAAGQPARAAAAVPALQLAETVFKDVRLLKGIPVDEFMDTMGFFSASTNLNCVDCHGAASGGDWAHYADETPMKATARRMILLMQRIDKENFGGAPVVTCYTCHRGDMRPEGTPSLVTQYGTPIIDPNTTEVGRQAAGSPTADQVFEKYVQALGGAQRLATISSIVTKGMYNGYDTEFEDVPIEIYSKAPAQRATVIHFRSGNSITTYDGHSGWISEADKPVPLIELTGDELDGARVDAALFFPSGIKQLRTKWEVGSAAIEDRQVFVAEGTGAAQAPVKLFFDKTSGLLVRQVRYVRVPVGRVPVQIDYDEYREVPGAGVKIPFRWTATWTDGRSKTTLTDVQPNAAIDASRVAKPPATK